MASRIPTWLVLAATATTAAPAVAQVSPAGERRAVDRAERLRQAGQLDEARTVLDDLLSRSPGSIPGLEAYAALVREAGDPGALLSYLRAATTASFDPVILDLLVESWIAVGSVDSALAVATGWARRATDDERAILALSSAQAAGGDLARAVRTLEEAAPVLGARPAVLARRADLVIRLGAPERAVDAWLGLLDAEEPRIDLVHEDLLGIGSAGAGPLARLVDALEAAAGPGATAGAYLALRLSEAEHARRLAAVVGPDARADFLREYTREADEAELPAEVAWAAGELVALSPRPVDRLRWRALSADRALAAGDTSSAREAFRQLAIETEPGDGPHGAATRRLFSLLAAEPGRLAEAETLLGRFGTEYPDSASARAHMYGELALGRARAGDLPGAEVSIARGRRVTPAAAHASMDAAAALLAFYRGDRDSTLARVGRSLADAAVAPAEQTSRLRLLTVAQAADSVEIAAGGAMALGLLVDPASYDPGGALRSLAGSVATPGRPVLLAYLATVAQAAGRPDISTGLRHTVVRSFAASAEAPPVLLDLAREAPPDEARQWLEQLIVGYPESALAPTARRLLRELEGGDEGE